MLKPIIPTGSTDGLMIEIDETTTPGVLLHSTVAGSMDSISIEACNDSGADITLTIEWGGATSDKIFKTTVPALGSANSDGLIPICLGKRLTGAYDIRAYASTTLNLFVTVDRRE
jgi:hypothetical protein